MDMDLCYLSNLKSYFNSLVKRSGGKSEAAGGTTTTLDKMATIPIIPQPL